jgi:hypothetical protein
MRAAIAASTYPAWPEDGGANLTVYQAVEPIWDVDEDCRRDPIVELPIDHAAIVETLVPLIVITIGVAALLISVVP